MSFNKFTEYTLQKRDDRREIQRQIITFLSKFGYLGYNSKCQTVSKKYLRDILAPMVKKLTVYIYNRKLCVMSFFVNSSEETLKDICIDKKIRDILEEAMFILNKHLITAIENEEHERIAKIQDLIVKFLDQRRGYEIFKRKYGDWGKNY